MLGNGKENRRELAARWMESITVVMGASLEDLKNQRRDRSIWKKTIYVVTES